MDFHDSTLIGDEPKLLRLRRVDYQKFKYIIEPCLPEKTVTFCANVSASPTINFCPYPEYPHIRWPLSVRILVKPLL